MRRQSRYHAVRLSLFLGFAALVMLHGSPAASGADSEPQASTPESAYHALVSAVAANDGAKVWSMLSQASQASYQEMFAVARQSGQESLAALHPLDRPLVEAIRKQVPADELRTMSPLQLFERLSSTGHLKMRSFLNAVPASVEAPAGDQCKVWITLNGRTMPLVFKRQGDQWTWDAFSLMMSAKALYDRQSREAVQGSAAPSDGDSMELRSSLQ